MLWDPNLLPGAHTHSTTEGPLALPKLNLQFLSFTDYLLRSYSLYRVESAYEIREDLMETIKYIGARPSVDGEGNPTVVFSGQ